MNKKEELIKYIKCSIRVAERDKKETDSKEEYQIGLEEGLIIAYEDILKRLEEEK